MLKSVISEDFPEIRKNSALNAQLSTIELNKSGFTAAYFRQPLDRPKATYHLSTVYYVCNLGDAMHMSSNVFLICVVDNHVKLHIHQLSS